MATADMASQFKETIQSLDLDSVPDKLKCAICSKLALNAYKLPCCGQSICDSCQQSLPASCPVCEHSPVAPDMCTPHKALRNTLKAYLKTAEKRLVEERLKSQTAPTPGPASSTVNEHQVSETVAGQSQRNPSPNADSSMSNAFTVVAEAQGLPVNGQNNEIKSGNTIVEPAANGPAQPSADPLDGAKHKKPSMSTDGERSQSDPTTKMEDIQKALDQPSDQSKPFSNGVSNDLEQTVGFPSMQNMNMNFGGMDYNQVLHNGMPGAINLGMMGMPGMNFMDPMVQMSQMYGGFGGPNMNGSINGMGMNFNANQGSYGGWGGQTNMWQGMQSMNNQNTFAHGMGSDFGSNSGYGYNFPQQENFAQQQYSNNDFQPGYHSRGYGHSGRGRARGYGRGRGTFNNFHHHGSNYQQTYQAANQPQNIPSVEAPASSETANRDEQIEKTNPSNGENVKTLDEEFAPGGLDDVKEAFADDLKDSPIAIPAPEGESKASTTGPETDQERPEDKLTDAERLNGDHETSPIDTLPTMQNAPKDTTAPKSTPVADTTITDESVAMPPPSAPLGPAAQFSDQSKDFGFRGRGRGGFLGRGRAHTNGNIPSTARPEAPPKAPTEPKGQGVVGAPTGPKSMRPGFVGPTSRGKGLGIQVVGRAAMAGRETPSQEPQSAKSDLSSKSHERLLSRSRSRSPHRSRRHRHRESNYRSESEDDSERHHDRRRRRSKYDDDHHGNDSVVNGEEYQSGSATPDYSSRHKDRQKSSRSSHPHRSSHRSHRHRSRSRGHDRHREEEDYGNAFDLHSGADKDVSSSAVESDNRANGHRRHKHRSHHRDHSHDSHRDRKRSRREYEHGEHDDYNLDKNEDEHRSRRQKRDEEIKIPTGPRIMTTSKTTEPEKDPHALEREARNRERMEKERQRRDATIVEESRRRDSRHERAFGGRRVLYKFEASPSRIEQEREAVRWR